ncbi:MAG TPA: hypothetical protein VFY93_01915 [Planctomycetota bacterium]|nr:hypothetical protein [Planctomycetota bacterium]
MPKRQLLLTVLILGACASTVAVGLKVLANWFFRGEAGISGDDLGRLLILGFVMGTTPVGLMWARSRKKSE